MESHCYRNFRRRQSHPHAARKLLRELSASRLCQFVKFVLVEPGPENLSASPELLAVPGSDSPTSPASPASPPTSPRRIPCQIALTSGTVADRSQFRGRVSCYKCDRVSE